MQEIQTLKTQIGLTQNPHPDPLPQGEGVKLPSLWGGTEGGRFCLFA